MATYKTPDVYVEEISVFPPSVAEVETCIPAFIGYTEKATKISNNDLINKPTRITSMLDYAQYFGGAPEVNVSSVAIDNNNNYQQATMSTSYYMYDSLRLFYANGGGDCYITSIGLYETTPSPDLAEFQNGLSAVEMVDEPTILVFPDAVSLSGDGLYTIQQAALSQANKLKDRFCVFDLAKNDAVGDTFRSKIGINYLKYGSAYTPWLNVSLSKNITYKNVKSVLSKGGSPVTLDSLTADPALKSLITDYNNLLNDINTVNGDTLAASGAYRNQVNTAIASVITTAPTPTQIQAVLEKIYDGFEKVNAWATSLTSSRLIDATTGAIRQKIQTRLNPVWTELAKLEYELDAEESAYVPQSGTTTLNNAYGWFDETTLGGLPSTTYVNGTTATDRYNSALTAAKALFNQAEAAFIEVLDAVNTLDETLENALLESFPLYKTIIQGMNDSATVMPPSGAVVGQYAATDRDRGVWKAPANVSLSSVVGPATTFTASQLDALNIDVNAGKSINAIRSFVGKGTLIWGARTLAGNDNEWRYIPVRRFFNTAEESIKKSTYWAVFEPNNGNTWIKVKGMIENYLTNKWKEGALVGAKPDEAFFVRIGLGQTMSAQDILEGYMKVEIGMAVVRPAEFIVLKFSHKLQQS
ncbi:MAG: phage tail sheath family protein [Bacteroidetes bacterium]|nr:phage tail sheath family protein [Bacteroidota bacterium]